MPTPDGDVTLLFSALSFAAARHRGQRRKGGQGSPYINHLIDVSGLLWTVGGVRDMQTIAAAVLHDTVEDTATTRDELASMFGEGIAGVVMEVTDDKDLPRDERRRRQVEHASSLSGPARLIKLADKTSNIRDIIASPPLNWTPEDQETYVLWGRDVVDRLRGTSEALEREFDTVCGEALRVIDGKR